MFCIELKHLKPNLDTFKDALGVLLFKIFLSYFILLYFI